MKQRFACLAGLLFAIFLAPAFDRSRGSALSAMPAQRLYRVYCASNDFDRHFCPADTFGGVDLVQERSEAPCVYGRTWGLSPEGIWVDRGCRAEFVVGGRGRTRESGYSRGRLLYCASDDFDVHNCPVNTYFGVRMVRQRSEAPCVYRRTWGYDDRGVWVDRGCRADFAVGRQSYRRYSDRDDRYDRDEWRR